MNRQQRRAHARAARAAGDPFLALAVEAAPFIKRFLAATGHEPGHVFAMIAHPAHPFAATAPASVHTTRSGALVSVGCFVDVLAAMTWGAGAVSSRALLDEATPGAVLVLCLHPNLSPRLERVMFCEDGPPRVMFLSRGGAA